MYTNKYEPAQTTRSNAGVQQAVVLTDNRMLGMKQGTMYVHLYVYWKVKKLKLSLINVITNLIKLIIVCKMAGSTSADHNILILCNANY